MAVRLYILVLSVATLLAVSACRGDEVVIPAEEEPVGEIDPKSPVTGFYLLNEGNMGSNKCTLDHYSYMTGIYERNIYASRNPDVVKELGDVGNDLKIYGNRLFAVINCSHKVEVMDAADGSRIGSIDIPNCRYINFHEGKAYVSSYVGPVSMNADAPLGMVYEIDIETLAITRKVTVGYQPEEIAIDTQRLYVANSGGYRAPDYDNTISVVDLGSFRQIKKIKVADNLHRLRLDSRGRLWASSRGNLAGEPSSLFVLEKDRSGEYTEVTDLHVPCSNLAFSPDGSKVYCISASWNNTSQTNAVSYRTIDTATLQPLPDFINPEVAAAIKVPYAIAVHPANGDIFLSDARNYVSSGTLYCLSASGQEKWRVRTGDIPACIAFSLRADATE